MFWVTFEKTISTVELKKKRKKAKERKKSECNNIFLNNYLIEKKNYKSGGRCTAVLSL